MEKLFQKAFGTCHNANGVDVDAIAAAAFIVDGIVDTVPDVVPDICIIAEPDDGIDKSGDTPAAATAANAFNNFKSFLRADDVTDPIGSTHIT